MKSLEEKRDKLSCEYAPIDPSNGHESCLEQAAFVAGWDACAKEIEQENIELKRQLEIVKKALHVYAIADDVGALARKAFKDLNED